MRTARIVTQLGLGSLLWMACRVAAQTWVWNVNSDGPWTNSANWVGPGGYPDGVGHIADFATLNITGTRRIRLVDADGWITIGTLLIGDNDQPYLFSNAVAATTWVFADSDGLSEIVVSEAYTSDKTRPHRIDGTIALSNDLRVTTLQARSHSDLWFWGAVTSDVAGINFTKAGRGTLMVLTNAEWSGATRILNGRLILATNGALTATSELELRAGAGLVVDNSGVNLANRVPDAAPILSLGGYLSFVHDGAAATDYSESLGQLRLDSGALTITSSVAAVGQASTLAFSSATRSNGVVGFVSTAFGDARNAIVFTNAPPLAGATYSDIVPYMIARTNGGVGADAVLVTHDGDGSTLRAYGTAANEGFATAEANFVSTTNARPPAGTTSLTAARTVQALVLDDGVVIDASGANRQLIVSNANGGVILQTGGTSVFNPASSSYDAVLSFGRERGIIYTVGTLELRRRSGSSTAASLRGTNGFIKAGPGDLVVNNVSRANDTTTVLNNLLGPIWVDEGRLIAQHANAFGGGVVYLNGGILALMAEANTKYRAQDGSAPDTNTPVVVSASVGTVLVGRVVAAGTSTHHTLGEIVLRPDTTLFVNFTNLTGNVNYSLIADGVRLLGDAAIHVQTAPGTGDGVLTVTNGAGQTDGLTDGGAGYSLTVSGNSMIRSELRVLDTLNLGGNLIVAPVGNPVGVVAYDGFTNVAGNITVGNGMLITPLDFSRELGSGAGQVRFVNGLNAGFGAVGNGTVNIALTSGGATNMLTWGEGDFAIGSQLQMNEDDAGDSTLVFWNGLDLNSTNGTITRTIQVDGGTAIVAGAVANLDAAVGVAHLVKSGGGTLWVTNGLGHNGNTRIPNGSLMILDPSGLSAGVLEIAPGNAMATLNTAGVLTRSIGANPGEVRLVGSGTGNNSRPGFSAWGGELVLDFGGDGSGTGPALVWNSTDFDPEGPLGNTGALLLNRANAEYPIYLLNPIDLNGSGETNVFARRFEVNGAVAVLGGQIFNSGEGFFDPVGILKRGGGVLVLAANNTYDGPTVIEAGTLVIGTNGTTGALGKGVVTNLGAIVFNRSNLYTVTNQITGTGSLLQAGTGTTVLTFDNDYSGPTTVSNGTLRINGAHTGAGLITVAGGRLEGQGSVAGAIDVLSGGTLAPGASPGQFTANSNVTLQSGATFEVELNGLTAGTQYDQLLMGSGTALTLSNPTLSVLLGFSPSLGDTFEIVSGFWTLSGAFNGLPTSGSTFMVGSTQFQIDYNTSDITLTVVPEPSTLSLLGLMAAAMLLRRRQR